MEIDEIINYVDTHYTDSDLSLKKLAQIFFYTERHISYLFREKTGDLFKNYILKLRMVYAQDLINNGEKSVSKISQLSGFKDPLYFSKVFSKVYGISPKKAIKQVSSNQSDD
jgi:two-component system response regulator YesN